MTPERFAQLDKTLLNMAGSLAQMSLATRSKVGALVYKDDRIVSMGWNGMPSGFPNEEIEYMEDGKLVTNPLVLHAEANAILKCSKTPGSSTENGTLYVTLSPCRECCKLIIQSGIKRVVYRDEYRITDGIDVLRRAGIKVERLV